MSAEVVELSWWERSLIGGLGGFAAVASKYLGQDHAYYLRLLDLEQQTKIDNLWLGYYIMAPLLIFLGALVAWASYENHRLKLLGLAVAAPALITTWAGGATSASKFTFDLISPAYAQDNNRTKGANVRDGLKLWFGVGRDDQRYRVVVGSYKRAEEASDAAAKINREAPDLRAFAGRPAPGNPYWAVVVSPYLPYPEAKKVQEKVMQLESVEDAYLSPFSDR